MSSPQPPSVYSINLDDATAAIVHQNAHYTPAIKENICPMCFTKYTTQAQTYARIHVCISVLDAVIQTDSLISECVLVSDQNRCQLFTHVDA